jgi:hypothetical protein
MIFDFDDWDYIHDCREELEKLKDLNSKFKVTLFTIPAKTTIEMLAWARDNDYWVELAQHGWDHHDNYECSQWTYEDCVKSLYDGILLGATGFKAPGWQISDDCYYALRDHGYWLADQPYNRERRPDDIKIYEVGGDSYHGHTWDCGCRNGIYEDWQNICAKVAQAEEFKFISEVL